MLQYDIQSFSTNPEFLSGANAGRISRTVLNSA
jgi:hypothetical protein